MEDRIIETELTHQEEKELEFDEELFETKIIRNYKDDKLYSLEIKPGALMNRWEVYRLINITRGFIK